MSRWLRTAILAFVITAIAIASIAHATTWVFWVPAQDNSPSNGTSATWGNYWNGVTLLFSNQGVNWQIESFGYSSPFYYSSFYISASTYYNNFPTGSSGYETWVALSSAYTLSGYVYQGVVGAYSNVAIGSTYTFSSGYQYFVAVAWYNVGTETCGQLYFHADVENTATSTAMFYSTYIIANATWSYVTFFSGTATSNSWFNPAVPGPSTCLKGYYVYIATIAVNVSEYTVGTAQVSIGTTSEGTSYTPGTQYSWSKSPASGDVIVVPWTSYANPYVVVYAVQQVVNTGGSSTGDSFYIAMPYSMIGTYPWNSWFAQYGAVVYANSIVYVYDNDTGFFPSNSFIVGLRCPANVYEIPASVSPSVTKVLSCQSLSTPSSGIAVYPTDYGRYRSVQTYNAPAGYLVSIAYTDSAGNTYSWSNYFAVPTPISIYINGGYSSIGTRQVSFSLQNNLTLYSLYPTSQYVYPQLNYRNQIGYALQMPLCTVSAGSGGLLNCVAYEYRAVSVVMWFYQVPGGYGSLISFENYQYPYTSNNMIEWLYIAGGYLWMFDSNGSWIYFSTPSTLSTGWHMLVAEEWYNSTSSTYYMALYLDGQLVKQVSSSSPTGIYGLYPYNYIGFAYSSNQPYKNLGWWFYNGTIAYVAIYNTVLNASQVQELYQVGFPNTLFSNNLVVAYLLTNTTYYVYDGVSHFYIKPYFANQQILSQLGISNASLITITPLGQVGWVPFTQWQQVTNYSVISYCKLMSYYTFNYLGGSKYQVVLVTNQNMNQFPLDYQFLITSGSGSQFVLPVYAYGNTNTFTNTTTATPTASAFLPVCDASPSNVPVAIETTAVTPVCNTNNIGYTATYTEKLPNGTAYTYTLTYILGTNASNLPPALVPTTILAYPYVLMLAALIIIVLAAYKFGDLGMRNSLILAGATAVVTVLAYLGVGNPYASFNLSCPNANAPVTVTVPLPQNIFLATTWLGIIAIILIIASLTTEYALW